MRLKLLIDVDLRCLPCRLLRSQMGCRYLWPRRLLRFLSIFFPIYFFSFCFYFELAFIPLSKLLLWLLLSVIALSGIKRNRRIHQLAWKKRSWNLSLQSNSPCPICQSRCHLCPISHTHSSCTINYPRARLHVPLRHYQPSDPDTYSKDFRISWTFILRKHQSNQNLIVNDDWNSDSLGLPYFP